MKGLILSAVMLTAGFGRAQVYQVSPKTFANLGERIAADRADAQSAYDIEIVFEKGVYRFNSLPTDKGKFLAKFDFTFPKQGGRICVRGATGAPQDVVFDGEGSNARAFSFEGAGRVDVKGITFRNFNLSKTGGAALRFDPYRTTNRVERCAFSGNSAVGDGGAVSGGNCYGCLFEGNRATCGGAYASGVAPRLSGAVVDCVFRNNRAEIAGGAVAGGAFTNCIFESNSCPTGRCSAAIGVHPHPLCLNRCVFRGNTAPLHYPHAGWQFRSYETVYGTAGNQPNSEHITENTIESWDYGYHGRTDGGPCTDSVTVKPGESILKARDFLRANRTPGKRAEIVLEDGVHPLTNLVLLTGFDRDLTVRARHPGKAIIAGGLTIRGADFRALSDRGLLGRLPETVRSKVVAVKVPERIAESFRGFSRERDICSSAPILTVDTEYMTLASWPNADAWFRTARSNCVARVGRPAANGKGVVSNVVFSTFTGRERRWNTTNADIFIYRIGGFAAGTLQVGEYMPDKGGIELPGCIDLPIDSYRFMNVLEEIDEPGEWCYDRGTRQLVFYPPRDFNKNSLVTLGLSKESFFDVQTHGVSFEGLVFTAKRGDWAIRFRYGRDASVLGCKFAGLNLGVAVSGLSNRVSSCDFEYVQGCAVSVDGGQIATLQEANNCVENCLADHCCHLRIGCAIGCIRLDGVGNKVSHCVIRHTREHALDWGGLGCTVEYCRMYDATREYRDSGVCYSPGVRTTHGCVFRYNDVSGSTELSHGVYPDDLSSGHLIYGNVIRNTGWGGVFLGGGRNNVISNNVIVHAGVMALHNDDRGLFWTSWCNTTPQAWKADMVKRANFVDGTVGRRWPEWHRWAEDGTNLFGNVDNVWVNNIVIDSGTTQDQVCKRPIPLDRQVSAGNVSVGLRTAPCKEHWRFGGFTEIDLRATPSRLFKDVPPREVISTPGAFPQFRWQLGDFNLAPDSVATKLIPGFQPIPWDAIGLYKDEWRHDIHLEKTFGDSGSMRQKSEANDLGSGLVRARSKDFGTVSVGDAGRYHCWVRMRSGTKSVVLIGGKEFPVDSKGGKDPEVWKRVGQIVLPAGYTIINVKGGEKGVVEEIVLAKDPEWRP